MNTPPHVTPAPGTKVISFDLDDTLIRGPFSQVLRDAMAAVTDSEDEATALRQQMNQRHRELLDDDRLEAYDWHQLVAETVGERDPGFDMLDRLEQYAADNLTQVLHEDTPTLLGDLRTHGWTTIILTNGWRRYQEPILRHAGLLTAVDELIASDDVGAPKPAEEMFLRARGGASVHVHVGDRIDHDIVGGNRSGASTVLLRRDAPEDPAQVEDYLLERYRAQSTPESDLPYARPALVTPHLSDVVAWVTDPATVLPTVDAVRS